MQRHLFNTVRCGRLIPRRAYASFSPSISIQAHEAKHLVTQPLPGIKTINLETRNSWPLWRDVFETPELPEAHDRCKAELPEVLTALTALRAKIELQLKDILTLPLIQTGADPAAPTHGGRTPITILSNIGISCSCLDLGLWKLQDFPRVEITDSSTRTACLAAREFDQVSTWHAFVGNESDPLLQAFDFTADFHSRDLTTLLSYEDDKTWIDLAPHDQGYARIEGVDTDSFSVAFAADLRENVKYFKEHPWRPNMYADFMAQHGRVSSAVNSNGKKAANVVQYKMDRPTWQLPDEIREQLIDALDVQDDEEVYYTEWSVCKRKKA